ncbi:U3-containing 90S pre-ribosomal complex subunit-domain containing protein [Ephemerocybe angulata]|uniref:U3-containing 90S pre-ribosomal complex subunit-domain containing protein n=1 Tax=Ephemerocybe angulata TaxID=980116 RepID=A0A8H6MGI6_9AGAR|nr:U3-containing 90S pre-ribosomal complex subunit-domain containing protein [Tulosesus angulatus]
MAHRGDDLEDDFVLDELVELSEEEGSIHEIDDDSNHEDEEEAAPSAPAASTSSDPSVLLKKRKRREKEKEKKLKKRKIAEATAPQQQGSVAAQSPDALSEYLSTMQKRHTKISSAIADTTSWTGERTLDNLTDFIMKALPTLHTRMGQRPKNNGAPTMLFITSAALRVADVTRILRDKRLRGEKGGEIAKLFAKHFKLSEHVDYLRRTKIGAAAGTPGRIGKLLTETGSLAVSALTHIILDNRNVLEIPETRDEVFKTVLGAPTVMKGIKEGKIQVILF